MERTLWGHLPLLVRANSKESVEFILQTLWRTRKSGLDADDRRLLCEMLQLQNESDLDPYVNFYPYFDCVTSLLVKGESTSVRSWTYHGNYFLGSFLGFGFLDFGSSRCFLYLMNSSSEKAFSGLVLVVVGWRWTLTWKLLPQIALP
ncbi:Detected protein of confused Function [Hibiscus syriacus]|uniref:Detected protein of confused Function n=1 Tax=Hibiscus syriacus TaxID=106335 RepID=A0A6A3AKU2_HIBSY|nr:Detected protein of confused Function [Hibiscus syriacus]